MIRRVLILIAGFILLAGRAFAGEKNVILRIQRGIQEDTLGYNLLEQVPAAVYKAVLENRIQLWDSPEKKVQIQPASLKELEQSNHYLFEDLDNMFVYETWLEKGNFLTVHMQGLMFATKTAKGDEINYGYVDYADVKGLLNSTYLNVNANGYINMSMDMVLNTKRFNFSVIQYGRKLITSSVESEKIKKNMREKEWATPVDPIPQVKNVTYVISGELKFNRNPLIDSLEQYFERNFEEYLNMGADHFSTHIIRDPKVKIDSILVEEVWLRAGNSLTYEPQRIRIRAGNMELETMSVAELRDKKIKIEGKSGSDYLASKTFIFQLHDINSQSIPGNQSAKCLDALKKSDWTHITTGMRN